MNQAQWEELFDKLRDVYICAAAKDEYVRSSLGDAIDHMILLQTRGFVTDSKVAQTPLR